MRKIITYGFLAKKHLLSVMSSGEGAGLVIDKEPPLRQQSVSLFAKQSI
jgi:hypothetical protein